MIALDIETSAWAAGVDRALANPPEFQARGNLRDPVKIAADIEQKAQSWRDKIVEQAALSPLTGRVVAWSLQGGKDADNATDAMDNEESLLEGLAEALKPKQEPTTICTFNGINFDIPFLRARMRHHGLAIPACIKYARKYQRSPHTDLRGELAGWERDAKGTLEDWCWLLGIDYTPTKPEWLGKMPPNEGGWTEIARCAREDARATFELYERAFLV